MTAGADDVAGSALVRYREAGHRAGTLPTSAAMPETDFDQEFVRFLLKFSDEAYLASGFHINAAGWIAWVRHVAEMGGKHVSNLDALRKLERLLDNRSTNPFRRGVREQ